MEKAPIKKFAVEARKKLKADVTFQLERYGITENGIVEPQTSTDKELVFDLGNGNTQTIKGERYVNQYRNLAAHVCGFYTTDEPKKELEQFIEEIAYTWFNRLIAIRFMEVNRYLPVRVLSSEITGQKLPDLVKAPFSGDLEFAEDEKKRIFELQDANKEDDLFRFLFFKQCNDLSRILPRLFENLEGHNSFSELLITLSFNDPNGVVYRLVNEVDERWFDIHTVDEDGKPIGQVQIIGWMYQYYNSELKDEIDELVKGGAKVTVEQIPAETQLFTPDWIVRYMVENSLGRLWYEGHPGFDKSQWKYYLDETPQEPQVEQQLQEIRAQYAKLEPEQLKVIDPCMGSGHILCYLFDVLMQIYLDNGYSKRETVRSILRNNLFGLDIDKRAAQIAYFSVMMKARQYDSNFFSRSNIPQPRVYDIQESNWLGGAYKHEMGNFLNSREYRDTLNYLLDAFVDAKEYGSILQIKPLDYEGLKDAWETSAAATAHDIKMSMWYDAVNESVKQLIEQAIILSQKYDVVVTNPPYIGSPKMVDGLLEYIKKSYQDGKADIYTAVAQKCLSMTNENRFTSMITQSTWMFQSRFESFRNHVRPFHLVNMVHLGTRAFDSISGEIVQTAMFTFLKHCTNGKWNTLFVKATTGKNESEKQSEIISGEGRFVRNVSSFNYIEGAPFAYYLPSKALKAFETGERLKKLLRPKQGTSTGADDRFVRSWYEINYTEIGFGYISTEAAHESQKKYFPLDKGGEFRKWFGNNEKVILYNITNYEKLLTMGNHLPSRQFYFQPGLTWSKIATVLSVRHDPEGFVFSSVGLKGFPSSENTKYILGFMNSVVCKYYVKVISPGMSIVSGDIEKIPLVICDKDQVDGIVSDNIRYAKYDWDAFETSWDFKKHPLV